MKRLTVLALGAFGALSLLWAISTEQLGSSFVVAAQERSEQRIAPVYRDDYAVFAVEILIDGVPQEKYPGRGKVYVEAVKGVEYALRIRNPLSVRVAVALSVDGLNTIDAKRTTATKASKWVIPPHGSITVGGWQMSSNRARRFYFTSEPDSYAAKLGRPSDIGMISAVFFREQSRITEIVPPPYSRRDSGTRSETERHAERPSASADGAAKSGSSRERAIAPEDDYAATGIGRSVDNSVYLVNLNLESRPIATMNVRYEYRPELVRLGVLTRPSYPEPDPLRRRELASGFKNPTFCPEP